MWNVKGASIDPHWLNLEPVEVLYDFDGPRIFICNDMSGDSFLAYMCGQDKNGVRYLVVHCSQDLKQRLVGCQISLRDALCQKQAWVFDLDNNWNARTATCVDIADLPNDALPRQGTMLYASVSYPVAGHKAVESPAEGDTTSKLSK
jgi:hypothetical protein